MSKKNVRSYSFDILYGAFYNGKLLNNLINNAFSSNGINDEDKAFIKKECNGVIENLRQIDNTINSYSKLKTNKLKDYILIALRLGTYEILYMDKVPSFAVVNEYVNIIKNSKYKNLSGYVNAVLKNISKNNTVKLNNVIKKYAYFRIFKDYENLVLNELKEKNIKVFPYSGTLNFKHTKMYYVEKYSYLLKLDSFKKGYILIIDASSAFLSDAIYETSLKSLHNLNSIKILDTCASPGGKILSLYDIFYQNFGSNNDFIKNYYFAARDISKTKIDKIYENMNRLKINNVFLDVCDATIYRDSDFEKYDIVICDVPCSGLGVINKKPDIALNFNNSKLISLVNIQQKILEVSKNYVKTFGLLSYSTCTETKEENEENICNFLNSNKNFRLIYEKRIIHGDSNNSDGFYISIMKKYD